ncbi:spermidine synthase [Pasteurella sp. 22655_41Tandhals]|uniref:spermidine synthase n=1 Tax=Pasteurella sp. 22655_41Tandhals TaxID=3416655 RepID=UPI003CFACED4
MIALLSIKMMRIKAIAFLCICVISVGMFLPEKIVNALVHKKDAMLEILIENKHGVIQVYKNKDNDHVVFGSNVYDGMLNVDIRHNSNGIHRAYLLPVIAPNAKNVLVVGLSTGSWVSVLSSMPNLESITVVELNPAYPKLAENYAEMAKVINDKRIKIVTDDGRRWLSKERDEKFDFILMNTTFHWRSYSTNLLSQEFLNLVKSHLREDGFVYFNTTQSYDAWFTAYKVYPYTYKYGSMALASLKAIPALDEQHIEESLSKLMWQNGQSVFQSKSELEEARRILMDTSLIPYESYNFSEYQRKPELITDKNMVTEYKYGLFSQSK